MSYKDAVTGFDLAQGSHQTALATYKFCSNDPKIANKTSICNQSIQFQVSVFNRDQAIVPRTTRATVGAQAEEKRQNEEDIARQALQLAEISVDQAMDLFRNAMPTKFLSHSSC